MNKSLQVVLFAPLVYAVVNFIDKYIIEKEVKDYRGMPIRVEIIGRVMSTLFLLTTGLKSLALHGVYLSLKVNILWMVFAVLMKFSIYVSDFLHILSYESWEIAINKRPSCIL